MAFIIITCFSPKDKVNHAANGLLYGIENLSDMGIIGASTKDENSRLGFIVSVHER